MNSGPILALWYSYILKFARELVRLEKAGKVGKGALIRASRERRVDQYDITPSAVYSDSPHSDLRILEKLADEGWREEIVSHREAYIRSITGVEGAYVGRPLTEKGMNAHTLEKVSNLKTVSSVEEDKGPDARGNARA